MLAVKVSGGQEKRTKEKKKEKKEKKGGEEEMYQYSENTRIQLACTDFR